MPFAIQPRFRPHPRSPSPRPPRRLWFYFARRPEKKRNRRFDGVSLWNHRFASKRRYSQEQAWKVGWGCREGRRDACGAAVRASCGCLWVCGGRCGEDLPPSTCRVRDRDQANYTAADCEFVNSHLDMGLVSWLGFEPLDCMALPRARDVAR